MKSYYILRLWKYRSAIKVILTDGRRQIPKDTDFNITPSLIFGNQVTSIGHAYGIGVVWGYWGIGVAFFKIK